MEIAENLIANKDIINQRITEARGRLRLHLGCGIHRLPGWVNIDVSDVCNPDIVCDISKGIPFHNKSITNIFSRDFMEHIPIGPNTFVINECLRVLKKGGVAIHEVPDVLTRPDLAYQDPTHVSYYSFGWAYYWMKNHKSNRWEKYGKTYGYTPCRLVKVDYARDKATKKPTGWLRMVFYK